MTGEMRDDIFAYGKGLAEGAWSVVTGIGNAFRDIGRGAGLYGQVEQTQWRVEDRVSTAFVKSYETNGSTRDFANKEALNVMSNIQWSPENIGRAIGRISTGILAAPAGAVAAAGDLSSAIEGGVHTGEAYVGSIIFGSGSD